MRWFRRNRRLGSRIALVAIAVQLALSFAHLHLDGIGLTPTAALAAAVVDAQLPSDKPDGLPARDCPTCALLQMAGASLPAAPPPLPLPTVLRSYFATFDAFLLTSQHCSACRARAPPQIS
jgi:hypothetical protein